MQTTDGSAALADDEIEIAGSASGGTGRTGQRFAPAVPQSLADTGLPSSTVEQLVLKFLYFGGDVIARDLAHHMGVRFSIIDTVIEGLKLQLLVQVKSSLGYGPISAILSLTEAGRRVARDYLG